jgi:small subunit ribosomal protein S27Ae
MFMAEAPAKKEKKGPAFKYKPAAKFCPKCGTKMAAHADRFACGKCTYTEFKKSPKGQ